VSGVDRDRDHLSGNRPPPHLPASRCQRNSTGSGLVRLLTAFNGLADNLPAIRHPASARRFQSAVSPISNRQGVGKSQRARTGRRPAEYNSAIRQSATLRYELCRPSRGPSSKAVDLLGEILTVLAKQGFSLSLVASAATAYFWPIWSWGSVRLTCHPRPEGGSNRAMCGR